MSSPDAKGPVSADLEAAWRDIEGRIPRLRTDRKLAELTIEVVEQLGNGGEHREALTAIAQGWTSDPALVLRASTLLIAQAERRGADEPVTSDDTPAHVASDALRKAIDGLAGQAQGSAEIEGRLQAALGNALHRCGAGDDADAQKALERALSLDPAQGAWWYDLGLLHKWRGRFAEGLTANQHAIEHGGPSRPARWNLAICATAVGDGDTAQDAWRALGIPARVDAETAMPYVDGLPAMHVRVLSRPSPVDGTSTMHTGVGFEIVWVAPLSPAHGVVQSPTFRDAPIDYGDLVLWDGAPVATVRAADGASIPVFPLLEILKQGNEHRWPFVALEQEPGGMDALEAGLPEGAHLFVQHERILPHPHASMTDPADKPSAPSGGRGHVSPAFRRGKLIVPASIEASAFRAAWERLSKEHRVTISIPALYETLGETKKAGQQHQAWRGIERKALQGRAGQ